MGQNFYALEDRIDDLSCYSVRVRAIANGDGREAGVTRWFGGDWLLSDQRNIRTDGCLAWCLGFADHGHSLFRISGGGELFLVGVFFLNRNVSFWRDFFYLIRTKERLWDVHWMLGRLMAVVPF